MSKHPNEPLYAKYISRSPREARMNPAMGKKSAQGSQIINKPPNNFPQDSINLKNRTFKMLGTKRSYLEKKKTEQLNITTSNSAVASNNNIQSLQTSPKQGGEFSTLNNTSKALKVSLGAMQNYNTAASTLNSTAVISTGSSSGSGAKGTVSARHKVRGSGAYQAASIPASHHHALGGTLHPPVLGNAKLSRSNDTLEDFLQNMSNINVNNSTYSSKVGSPRGSVGKGMNLSAMNSLNSVLALKGSLSRKNTMNYSSSKTGNNTMERKYSKPEDPAAFALRPHPPTGPNNQILGNTHNIQNNITNGNNPVNPNSRKIGFRRNLKIDTEEMNTNTNINNQSSAHNISQTTRASRRLKGVRDNSAGNNQERSIGNGVGNKNTLSERFIAEYNSNYIIETSENQQGEKLNTRNNDLMGEGSGEGHLGKSDLIIVNEDATRIFPNNTSGSKGARNTSSNSKNLEGRGNSSNTRPAGGGSNSGGGINNIKNNTNNNNISNTGNTITTNNITSGLDSHSYVAAASPTTNRVQTRQDSHQEIVAPFQSMTPGQVLKKYIHQLTPYEQGEILDYTEIYYFGTIGYKGPNTMNEHNNFGFDDDKGDYIYHVHDHISYRYEILDRLGKGSFGQVFKCIDHKTGQELALKIIKNKKRFHRQAVVEVRVLETIKTAAKDGIRHNIEMIDYFLFRRHLVISFELLSINLYEFIKANNFRGFSLGLIRRFAIQILLSLSYMRKLEIIHCDLKPENILLKTPTKSGIKVIDFGSSCFEKEKIYTYIQSRFYRAPEIILGIPYTTAIDMWSFACILVELYTGYPIFAGESETEQLACMMEVKSVPPIAIIKSGTRWRKFFETDFTPILNANSRGKVRRPSTKSLSAILSTSDQNFYDFIEKCLEWDPMTRLTPDEALTHEWIIEGLHKLRIKPSASSAGGKFSGNSSVPSNMFNLSYIYRNQQTIRQFIFTSIIQS